MHSSYRPSTVPTRTSLDVTKTSCHRCTEARQHRKLGCENCLKETQLKNNFPKVKTMSSKSSAGYVEATLLCTILKRHAKNPRTRYQTLEAIESNPKSVKPCSTSRNAAVQLVKENVDHSTPAIWLHPAEGTAPTMHYYSWCALDRLTPRENKIYVNMDSVTRPAHKRGEHCENCVFDAWQNASLSMMAMAFTKIKLKETEEHNVKEKKAEKQKSASVRKAFGSLRESFRSQNRREDEALERPQPTRSHNVSARRIWRT